MVELTHSSRSTAFSLTEARLQAFRVPFAAPTRPPPAALFIPEILNSIFYYLRYDDYESYVRHQLNTEHTFDEVVALYTHALPAQIALMNSAVVCRAWNPCATEALYRCVILISTQHLWKFAEMVTAHPELRYMLREFYLLDSPHGSSRLFPPLAGLNVEEPTKIRRQAAADFVRILKVCRQIHTVGVHYGREETLFPQIKDGIHEELSGLRSLKRWTADGHITSHVAWDAPEGIAKHVEGNLMLTDISMHEMFADLRTMIVPVMRKLTVRNCRCEHLTWLIPNAAPSLQELILTDNIVLNAGPDPSGGREALVRTAPTLREITLKGAAEWRYFRTGGWDAFPNLLRMVIGFSTATRLDCSDVELPPNLHELVVVQPASRFDIIMSDDEPGQIIRELEIDEASLSSWSQLRVDVDVDLAEEPDFLEGAEHLRAICANRRIDLKFYGYGGAGPFRPDILCILTCQLPLVAEQSVEGKPFFFALPTSPSMVVIWCAVRRGGRVAAS
jgi:hypothetical protein